MENCEDNLHGQFLWIILETIFGTISDKISEIILGTISDVVVPDRQSSGSHKGTTSRQSLGGCQADVKLS